MNIISKYRFNQEMFVWAMVASLQTTLSFGSTFSLQDYTGPECGSEPVFSQASQCGPASYITTVSSNCPAIYQTLEHDSCGAAQYNYAESSSCGVAVYNTKVDGKICGTKTLSYEPLHPEISCAKENNLRHIVLDQNDGYYATGVTIRLEKRQTGCGDAERPGHCRSREFEVPICELKKPLSCEHSSFGPKKFKGCEHPAHGVRKWNSCPVQTGFSSCEHPSHGVASWKTCETGRSNKTCQVYFPPAELSGYLSAEGGDIGPIIDNIVNWSETFLKVAGDTQGMGCLIQNIIANSGFAGDHVFDATVLDGLKNTYQSMSGKRFNLSDFSVSGCQNPLKDVKNYLCLTTDTSAICAAKSGYVEAVGYAKSKLGDYSLLVDDAVLKSQSTNLSKVTGWKTSLEQIITQADTP